MKEANHEADRALARIGRVVNRRFPELERFLRETEIPPAVARDLQQLALHVETTIASAERRATMGFVRRGY